MSTVCFLIYSVIFQTFELYLVKSMFTFGKISICLVRNDYPFKRGDIIGCLPLNHLLLHVYHCIGFRMSSRHGAK